MAARGYVAVNLSFHINTDKVLCTANKAMVITGEYGASISLKKGEKFYAVRAGSLGENMWYIVRMVSGEKKCSCPANKPCVHEVYVTTGKPLVELRAEVEARTKARKVVAKPAVKVVPPVVAKVAPLSPSPALVAKLATLPEYCASSSLNGNRGFSLLK